MEKERLYDVVIIGGGPAGLTAAIYLARACYRVLVVEKEQFGGQITITSEVVNYPGVKSASGKELTEAMRAQAEYFGAEFAKALVRDLTLTQDVKTVHTSRGDFFCLGIVLATGAHPRKIGFEGEETFQGHGVAYCATCDGEFFAGKEVFVAGGGFAAAEESVFLTKYASHVTILVREEDFTCSKTVAHAARSHDKITVLTNTQIVRAQGDTMLRTLVYKNTKTGEVTEYHAENGDTFGIFVFAGYEPETLLLKDRAELNEQGYVVTDRTQQTTIPGVYAAGDVCVKNLRQVVTAVGDGAVAATELERYVALMQEKTGVRPQRLAEPEQKREQLDMVFAKMEKPLQLVLYLDERPISAELREYMEQLAEQTNKLHVVIEGSEKIPVTERPFVDVCDADGVSTGIGFHGVPGGHEFTSFILGLYNASGSGQRIDEDSQRRIQSISAPIQMKLLVSLSCTMCPELVTAAQKVAAMHPLVTAQAYDLNHFAQYREKYDVMSVPCLVVNEEKVSFGKKSLEQLLDFLEE